MSRREIYQNFLIKRRYEYLTILLVVVVFAVISAVGTGYKPVNSITSIPRSLQWMFNYIVPDVQAWSRLPNILEKLGDTVISSLSATVLSAVFAFFAALTGSRVTAVNPLIAVVSRTFASFFRNIPVAAWALVFLFSFGQTNVTGFLALFFVSFGFLTRSFIETIDETSSTSVEALRATGATRAHVIFQAVLPESLPQMVSWVLFCLETNIRSAAMVGMLTGTGIGFSFTLYYRRMQYSSAWLVVLSIVLVVLGIEFISNRIRKAIL